MKWNTKGRRVSSAIFRPLLEVLESRIAPAVAVWTGADAPFGNNNWSDSGNWVSGYVPHVGDDVAFPASAFSYKSNNDFATSPNPAVIGNIHFPDPVAYTLTGNALILNGGITDDSGANNFIQFAGITLGFSQTFVETVSGPGSVRPGLVINSPIDLNGNVLALESFDYNLANEIGEHSDRGDHPGNHQRQRRDRQVRNRGLATGGRQFLYRPHRD